MLDKILDIYSEILAIEYHEREVKKNEQKKKINNY